MGKIDEIVAKRRKRIESSGYEMGLKLPLKRSFPIIPFGLSPFLICEIKRSSPSRGRIAPAVDAVEKAKHYIDRGIKTVSVLTEEDYFSGSLRDLFVIKRAFPNLSILRKDFIIDEEDIEVSYRAGADAVLLIASMHDQNALFRLYRKAKTLGMEVLFEVHDENDIRKARVIKPDFTGFNSRDLNSFKIDLIQPVKQRSRVTWDTVTVFESGLLSEEDAVFALSSGFSGLLVGEAVMRNEELIEELFKSFSHKRRSFWFRLFSRKKENIPLTKICGITREKDAFFAKEMGADMLGFVFADSPRRAGPELLKRIRELDILKAGVVVNNIDPEVKGLLEDGFLDVIQFHGEELPEDCFKMAFPYFKALRIKAINDIGKIDLYHCPRVLIDTFVHGIQGGTGKRISDEILLHLKDRLNLWLAGGIGPENVRDIIEKYRPELIDASSMLESSYGVKDHDKIKKYFEEISIEKAL